MWSDNETTNDLLGFQVHAELLESLVLDDGILPITIGVFGDWGSGKSSIMRMMEARLNSLDDQTVCLYFNGWVFEGYDDAKAALLDSILKVFDNEKRFGPKVKQKATLLFKSVNWMRVMGLGFKNVALPLILASMGGPVGWVSAISSALPAKALNKIAGTLGISDKKDEQDEEVEPVDFSTLVKEMPEDKAMLVREFRQKFEELLDETKIKRLVVLIDDLDRCSPERLIENLEAIKLFLNVPRTAFVIGADPRIVRHAIEYRYKSRITSDEPTNADTKTERISDQFVKDYLEKLIQVPYHLPRLSDPEVETYLSLLFCEKNLPQATHQNVLKKFSEFRATNRYGAFGFADINSLLTAEDTEKLKQNTPLITSLGPVITEGLNGNPRQIKRFLNSFTLRTRLATVAKITSLQLDVLGKIMVLEYVEPDLFRKLYDWQSHQKGESEELANLENLVSESKFDEITSAYGADWNKGKVQRWLRIEPKLKDIDLRDYFWLSRDQLSASISGASLIPPMIKTMFRELMEYGSEKILVASATKAKSDLAEHEQDLLLGLLEQEIVKRSDVAAGHQVFFQLVAAGMPASMSRYKAALSKISHDKIPFSLHNNIILIGQKVPAILELLGAYKAGSPIRKAIDGKKK